MNSFCALLSAVSMGIAISEAWRPFNVRMKQLKCHPNEEFIGYINCSVTKVKRSADALNINIHLTKDMIKPKIDLLIIARTSNDDEITIFNVTNFEACAFLEAKGVFGILQVFRKELEKVSNLPSKCPVRKETQVGVKNFIPHPDIFPPYTPDARMYVRVFWKEQMTNVLSVHLNGSVEYKKKLKKSG